MPNRKPEIIKNIVKNKATLIQFIKEYVSKSEEEDFDKLKEILMQKL